MSAEWKLTTVDSQERNTWMFAMHAASQLPEWDPLMWMMLLHLYVTQKSNYNDDDDDDFKPYMIGFYRLYLLLRVLHIA